MNGEGEAIPGGQGIAGRPVSDGNSGMPPLKWSTFWDMIIPFLGGLNDGWKARETRRYRAEAATG